MVADVCSVSGCLYYRLYRPSRKAYGAHIVAWIARPQSILGELADETCWTMRELREGKHGVLVGVVVWGVMGLVVVGMVVMGVLQQVEMERMKERLGKVEGEMLIMSDILYKVQGENILMSLIMISRQNVSDITDNLK